MAEPLCLLTVHAHPDDESSKGASMIARYHDEGVKTVLVCCTGGEEGDILNPAMDRPEVRERLTEIRQEELDAAAEVIGFDVVERLGYRDSGMAGTPANDDPRSFARADADEAIGALVSLIRRHRPQVVVTYGDDQELYPHPDHLRVHDVTVPAFEAAGDPSAYPDMGEPWVPAKLYYSVWSIAKLKQLHQSILDAGGESPFPEDWSVVPDTDHRITTVVDVTKWVEVREAALRAHATQVDPTSPMWFGRSPELELQLGGTEELILARSTVATSLPEDDLFEGLR